MIIRTITCLATAFTLSSHVGAETPPAEAIDKSDPEVVFAYQGDAVLTQSELDASFSRLDDETRLPFIRDGGRVNQLVKSLMKSEVLALDAKANGFDKEPIIADRIRMAAEKELAEAWMEQIARNAPEADYEAMAYEDYLAHPEKYRTEQRIDVSHILISSGEGRTVEAAKELAESLREQLLEDPSQFEEMVQEYSDDPGKVNNNGAYPNMKKGQMIKPFEDAAFALENEGEISDVVETIYGFHIIRLEKIHPTRQMSFEEVRDQAMAEMERDHRQTYLATYITRLFSEPIVLPEGSVEIMLKRYFGENLENAPRYDANGNLLNSEG